MGERTKTKNKVKHKKNHEHGQEQEQDNRNKNSNNNQKQENTQKKHINSSSNEQPEEEEGEEHQRWLLSFFFGEFYRLRKPCPLETRLVWIGRSTFFARRDWLWLSVNIEQWVRDTFDGRSCTDISLLTGLDCAQRNEGAIYIVSTPRRTSTTAYSISIQVYVRVALIRHRYRVSHACPTYARRCLSRGLFTPAPPLPSIGSWQSAVTALSTYTIRWPFLISTIWLDYNI